MFNKNQIVETTIEDVGVNGEGIGKPDGFPIFIKDAVIGDTVVAKLTKVKKTYAYAHLEEVKVPSKWRQTPPCPVARQCGGCQMQQYVYSRQLEYKQSKVRNNLIRIGAFSPDMVDEVMQPIIGMDVEDLWRYRNKAQYPVGYDKEGNLTAGFYATHSHRVIATSDCLLNHKESGRIVQITLQYMRENSIRAYEEETGQGLVRHILTRFARATGQWMVCLVINGSRKDLRNIDAWIMELKKIEGMTSICISVNRQQSNVILGDSYEVIWGQDHIVDRIGETGFQISPLSFYQVNPVQTMKLYRKAVEYAYRGETSQEIWDLYCGIGTISLFLAQTAENGSRVHGVEIVPEAVINARENASLNAITNADFQVGKAEEILPDYYRKTGKGADVVVVDPPRKGCDETLLSTILEMAPERIVYVSCDSATLARDLKILCDGTPYRVEKVQPVDMFPMTVHVETVALLSRT